MELNTEIGVEELFGPITMPKSISWDQWIERMQQIIRDPANKPTVVIDSIHSGLEVSV